MASLATNTRAHKTLITGRSWDDYDLDSLLPLKETYRENTEFGFLLRHYWIPATELRFRQSSRVTAPDGNVERQELQIDRRMARCRSNECTWREKVRPVGAANEEEGDSPHLPERPSGCVARMGAVPFSQPSEMLCSYDCYEQTYVSAKPILFALPTDDQKVEARRQALYRLPMLVPPGPVPIGFSWYGEVDDDYMNFRLEGEERLGETSVLVIRREGRYTTWLSKEVINSGKINSGKINSGNGQETTPVVTERKGVTLFAWNRGALLEDRFWDRIVEVGEHSVLRAGRTNEVVTRLVRSCPTE